MAYNSSVLIGYTGHDLYKDAECSRILKRAEFLKAVCDKEGVRWLPKECLCDKYHVWGKHCKETCVCSCHKPKNNPATELPSYCPRSRGQGCQHIAGFCPYITVYTPISELPMHPDRCKQCGVLRDDRDYYTKSEIDQKLKALFKKRK